MTTRELAHTWIDELNDEAFNAVMSVLKIFHEQSNSTKNKSLRGAWSFAADPELRGYIFSGWAKEGSADTVAFNLESLNIVMFDADVTLYAVWDKILYTVIYNVGPSDVHIPTNTAVIWEDKPLDNYATVQGRPGYTFVGWYGVAQERDANGNPIVISADSRLASTASFGDIVKELGLTDATVPTEGITLYAHYKGEITTLTYAVKPGEGKGWVSNSSDTLNVGDGVPKGSDATPDPGDEFLGWYDERGECLSREADWQDEYGSSRKLMARFEPEGTR